MSLVGKISIVTGSGSGIGRAISLKLSHTGSTVIVVDVYEEGGLQTVKMIKETGGNAEFFKVDVSKEEEVKELAELVSEKFDGADILVNNAGIEPKPASILETPTETYDKVMSINLKGAWLAIKYFAPHMIKKGGGSIVNIASVAGIKPLAGALPYSLSKAGVIMLTKVAALELSKFNIRVNAVAPGWVETPMVERAAKNLGMTLDQFKKVNSQRIALGRFASPEEIASLVVFLASNESSYITGETVIIDGGILLT